MYVTFDPIIAEPINPLEIESIGFMIGDKKPGAFQIEFKKLSIIALVRTQVFLSFGSKTTNFDLESDSPPFQESTNQVWAIFISNLASADLPGLVCH